MDFLKKYIGDIPVYIYKTKKIKSINISLKFFIKSKKEYYYNIASLGKIFTTGSIKYNTPNKYVNASSKVYFPRGNYSEYLYNEFEVVSMNYRYLNGKYFNCIKQDYNNSKLFRDLFFDVNHNYKHFEFTKRRLINYLLNLKDNSANYSEIKAFGISERNCPFYVSLDERLKLAKEFSIDKVKEFYDYMIHDSKKMMFIVGDVDESIIDNYEFLKDYINNKECSFSELNRIGTYYNVTEPIYEKEELDTGQSRLVLSYYYDKKIDLKNDYLCLMFLYMFCNADFSLLFNTLREENSLCYSISGYTIDSICYVSLGIKKENYQKCLDLINLELEKVRNGEIEENILNQTKKIFIDNIENSDDDPYSYVGQYVAYVINNYKFPFSDYNDECIKSVNSITIKDIVNFSKGLKFDNCFFLSGGSDNEE